MAIFLKKKKPILPSERDLLFMLRGEKRRKRLPSHIAENGLWSERRIETKLKEKAASSQAVEKSSGKKRKFSTVPAA